MTPRWIVLLTLVPAVCAATLQRSPAAPPPTRRGTCELAAADRRNTPSSACMACHDGSAGARVGFQMRADGHGMSHPVTVAYATAAAANPGQYHAPGALPPEVPLVRGRVECTSCHDGASPDPKRVVVVRDLCLACHRL